MKRILYGSMVAMAVATVSAAGGHSHGHGEAEAAETSTSWERSAVWDLANGSYVIEFCTSSEELLEAADGGMIYAMMPVASQDEAEIANVTAQATALRTVFSSTKVFHQSITNGSSMQLKNGSVDVLYRVEFAEEEEEEAHEHEHSHTEGETHCVVANVAVPAGKYMLFTEHGADEVAVRVIDGATNEEVALLACVSGCETAETSTGRSQSWGAPILASLLISITSLLGVFILSFDKGRVEIIVEYMSSFAAGCLIGVVVFHLYPEGSEYLADLGEWVMGAYVLGGIAFSMALEQSVHMLLGSFGAHNHDHGHGHGHSHGHSHGHPMSLVQRVSSMVESREKALSCALESPSHHSNNASHHHLVVDVSAASSTHELQQPFVAHQPQTPNSGSSATVPGSTTEVTTFRQKYITSLMTVKPVAWITAIGDFFHAFTDGVVLAVAFKSCSSSLGWAVMLGIVLHEVPHRVGDFFIFLKAGMIVPQALFINFLASLASFIGVIILLAAGAVSEHALGVLLALGTGALLFIAMSELLPPMLSVQERKGALLHFVWFSLGCVLIGLSKLQDVHCDAATGQEISH